MRKLTHGTELKMEVSEFMAYIGILLKGHIGFDILHHAVYLATITLSHSIKEFKAFRFRLEFGF
jgi:hypothetical protein